METVFKILFFAGIVGQVIIRYPYDRLRRQVPKTEQRQTLSETIVLTELSIGGLLLPLIYSLTHWIDFADYPAAPSTKTLLGIAGVVVLLDALALFWRSHYDLGKNWSPTLEIGEQHALITHGIYGIIRHPMYASQFLFGLSQALLLPNWLAGWGGMLAFLLLIGLRMPSEERMMLDHFGDEYRAYCARTGRVFPRIRG